LTFNKGSELNKSQQLSQWNKLTEDFRSFGGTAENLLQREGSLGLGLFPIDPSQPVELCVPDHLLISTDNLELRDGAIAIKNPSGYPSGYSDWYERFQANYSWGAEARQSIKIFEDSLKSLPDSLQRKLNILGLSNANKRYPGINEEQELFQRFIATRQIVRNNRKVLMPMMELVNHSPNQKSWIMAKDSISIRGQYKGEILVRYSVADPLRRCIQYGFNCKEPLGFSVNLNFNHNDKQISIKGGINYDPFNPVEPDIRDNIVIINKPLIGSTKAPRLPKTLFKQMIKDNNQIEANELFDRVCMLNRIILLDIYREIEVKKITNLEILKTSLLDQIDAISQHYGERNFEKEKSQAAT